MTPGVPEGGEDRRSDAERFDFREACALLRHRPTVLVMRLPDPSDARMERVDRGVAVARKKALPRVAWKRGLREVGETRDARGILGLGLLALESLDLLANPREIALALLRG